MGEIILIMGVALVFLGPEKFPVFAKVIMHAYRDFTHYKDEIMREVTKELAPVRKELKELSRFNPEDYVESLALAVSTEPKDDKKSEEKKEAENPPAEAESAQPEPADGFDSPSSGEPAPQPEGTHPRATANPGANDYPYPD
jgi:Sec-independent protein translocase protein TatA